MSDLVQIENYCRTLQSETADMGYIDPEIRVFVGPLSTYITFTAYRNQEDAKTFDWSKRTKLSAVIQDGNFDAATVELEAKIAALPSPDIATITERLAQTREALTSVSLLNIDVDAVLAALTGVEEQFKAITHVR